jgi:fused signal recognition particle receptor
VLRRWMRRESRSAATPGSEAVAGDVAGDGPMPDADADKLEQGLARTRRGLLGRLAAVFGPTDVTEETWEELQAQLIMSDVGAAMADDLVAETRAEARRQGVRRADELPAVLHHVIVGALRRAEDAATTAPLVDAAPAPTPWVTLVVGVNGGGKTTTIAKLADLHRRDGRRVLLVAADTFRAAAIDQLRVWGERVGVPVTAGQPGADPGSVVFDALSSTAGRSVDVVIIDTAGRLHTQHNLMAELVKVRNVASRVVPGAPHETLLVLDATTGQNGLAQARAFAAAVDVTALVLAKLDSSARGGVALAITRDLGLPIWYVGTGEQLGDLAPFDAERYADGLLGRTPPDA